MQQEWKPFAANTVCAGRVRASMRSARSACLLVARTARCFYHEGLPLAPSSCPSSPSRSRLRSRPCSQRQQQQHLQQHSPQAAKATATAEMLSRALHSTHRQQQRPQQRRERGREQEQCSGPPAAKAGQCKGAKPLAAPPAADRPEVAKGVEAFSWREWEDYSSHPPENF